MAEQQVSNRGNVDVLGGLSTYTGSQALYWALADNPGERAYELSQDELRFEQIDPRILRLVPREPEHDASFYRVPDGVEFWCVASDIEHEWGIERYLHSRCAYFMGIHITQKMLANSIADRTLSAKMEEAVHLWRAMRHLIPAEMGGAEYLGQYGAHEDDVAPVSADAVYKVRLATEHHVYEMDRIIHFGDFLYHAEKGHEVRHAFLRAAGDLLIQSHFSLDHRCGLGAPETDLIMNLARERGPERGVYGARVAGRGAGGNVVVMTDTVRNAQVKEEVEWVAEEYKKRSGLDCRVISGLPEA